MNDTDDSLERFVIAQDAVYDRVLRELTNGRKQTHWMWFIFPQVAGLGHSAMALRYGIGSLEEARRYLSHPVLGTRLAECARLLLALETGAAAEVFDYPDDLKLHSSMTLFALAAGHGSVFEQVLHKFFAGAKDVATLRLLGLPTS